MTLGKDGETDAGIGFKDGECREEKYVEQAIWENEGPDCAYPFENNDEWVLDVILVIITIRTHHAIRYEMRGVNE